MTDADAAAQPTVDSHHHFWARPDQTFLPADLLTAVAASNVVATIYVECSEWYRTSGPEHLRPVGETEWVVDNAPDVVKGMVANADLRRGAVVAEVLEAHAAAGGGLVKGIRQMSLYDPEPGSWQMEPFPGPALLGDPGFREGYAQLGRAGFHFEALVWFHQLPEVVDLATAFPDTTIVVNHLGGPSGLRHWRDRRDEMVTTWRANVAAVAACPNVVMKVGGIGMGLYGVRWDRDPHPPSPEVVAARWQDEVRYCVDVFGPGRTMAESNFPVDLRCMPYDTLWSAMRLMTSHLDPTERAAFFHDTATRVYRL